MRECRPYLLEEITEQKKGVETPMDHIIRSTHLEAIRYSRACSVCSQSPGGNVCPLTSSKDSPVAQALNIKFAAHMFAKPFTLYGSETLGVQERLADKGVTYCDRAVPLPTFLNYQLDTLAMMCIQGYQKDIIKSLRAKLFTTNRAKNWYEVFLTIFVLLGNLEYLYQAQLRYIQRHKKTVRVLPENAVNFPHLIATGSRLPSQLCIGKHDGKMGLFSRKPHYPFPRRIWRLRPFLENLGKVE
jgi:hypothetical protein